MVPTLGGVGLLYICRITPFYIKMWLCVTDQMCFASMSWSFRVFKALRKVSRMQIIILDTCS